ncbi:MAG: ribosome biogenesis GTP-binding protein YsxC [Bdellovibrionales bacterium]|nr:ribosome biogenesis GTP-binding protein YsxC [Bdellovibrionales bacterium]
MQNKCYLITLGDPEQLPGLIKKGFLMGHAEPRIAFVGRSNVGKSSLINALMGERVARVSATPGKTRAIHFFLWGKTNRIVADLPGYGFAKVAKTEHKDWARLMNAYFEADNNVEVIFMLFDSRHGPTDSDIEALEFFLSKNLTVQVVMTKYDQLKNQSDRAIRKREVEVALAPYDVVPEEILWMSINDQKRIEFFRKQFK